MATVRDYLENFAVRLLPSELAKRIVRPEYRDILSSELLEFIKKGYFTLNEIQSISPPILPQGVESPGDSLNSRFDSQTDIELLTSDNAIKGYENKCFTFNQILSVKPENRKACIDSLTSEVTLDCFRKEYFTFDQLNSGFDFNNGNSFQKKITDLTSKNMIQGFENKCFTFSELRDVDQSLFDTKEITRSAFLLYKKYKEKLTSPLPRERLDFIVNATIEDQKGDTFKLSKLFDELKASGLYGEHLLSGIEIDFDKYNKFKNIDCSGVDFTRCRLINVPTIKNVDFSNSNFTEATISYELPPLSLFTPRSNFKGANLTRCLVAGIPNTKKFFNSLNQQNQENIQQFNKNSEGLATVSLGDRVSYLKDGGLQSVAINLITGQRSLITQDKVYKNILKPGGNCYGFGDELQRVIGKGVSNGLTVKESCDKFIKKLENKRQNRRTMAGRVYEGALSYINSFRASILNKPKTQEYVDRKIKKYTHQNFPRRIFGYQKNYAKTSDLYRDISIDDLLGNKFLESTNSKALSNKNNPDVVHIGLKFPAGLNEKGLKHHIIEAVKLEDNQYFVYDSNGFAIFAKNEYECNLAASALFRCYQNKGYEDREIAAFNRTESYNKKGLGYTGSKKVYDYMRNEYTTKSQMRKLIQPEAHPAPTYLSIISKTTDDEQQI